MGDELRERPHGGGGPAVSARKLTPKQAKVLAFIQDYQRDHGFAPTLREIGRHMGVRSTNGINDYMLALTRKGYISRSERHARSIVVTPQRAPDSVSLVEQAVNLYSLMSDAEKYAFIEAIGAG